MISIVFPTHTFHTKKGQAYLFFLTQHKKLLRTQQHNFSCVLVTVSKKNRHLWWTRRETRVDLFIAVEILKWFRRRNGLHETNISVRLHATLQGWQPVVPHLCEKTWLQRTGFRSGQSFSDVSCSDPARCVKNLIIHGSVST